MTVASRSIFRVVCNDGEPCTTHHPYERRYQTKAEAVLDQAWANSYGGPVCWPHKVQRSNDKAVTWKDVS